MNRILFEGILDGVVIDRIIRNDEFSMPTMHFHPEFEVYYLLEGSRYYFIENETYLINKGCLVLIDTMQIHKTSTFGKDVHDRILIELTNGPFSELFELVSGLSMKSFFSEYACILELNEAEQQQIEGLLFSLMDEFKHQQPHFQSLVMMRIAELFLFVARRKADKGTAHQASMSATAKHKRIRDVILYISENYNRVKSLEEISKHFFVNKSYLSRTFKEVTGFTVQEYININCVKKAQELLEQSQMSVSEISCCLGYGSVTHFERMFRKYTETTPLKYRKKMRLTQQKVRERKPEALIR